MLDGKVTAWAKCPNGHIALLENHEIRDDGTLDASVDCEGDWDPDAQAMLGCTFHEMVKLDGWEG